MDLIDLPTKKKTTAKDVFLSTVGFDCKSNTRGANFLIATGSLWTWYANNYIQVGVLVSCMALAIPNHQLTSLPVGTGGSEYSQLSSGFISSDENYFCNGQEWGLRSGLSSTVAYYASSTPLGTKFQIDFKVSSSSVSGFGIGRPDLYEIVAGENSPEYLSIKKMPKGDFLELSKDDHFDGVRGRIRLKNSLASDNLNSLFISEELNDSGKIQIRIKINEQEFLSEPITLEGSKIYKSLYISLLANKLIKTVPESVRAVYMPLNGPCL